MPIIIVGVECEDGARYVYYTQDFEQKCKELYIKHPNYLSILTLELDEVETFLRYQWKDEA